MAEEMVGVLNDILSNADKEAISPFVSLVREAEGINSHAFDNYSIFRDKWNILLTRTEQKIAEVGVDSFDAVALRSPELGVIVRQA